MEESKNPYSPEFGVKFYPIPTKRSDFITPKRHKYPLKKHIDIYPGTLEQLGIMKYKLRCRSLDQTVRTIINLAEQKLDEEIENKAEISNQKG
jgi:hypothetical protein